MNYLRVFIAAAALALIACSSTKYYEITDPTTGKVYYSTEYEQGTTSGTISLTDAGTGAQVTIQTSEIKEISEPEFMSNAYDKQRNEAMDDVKATEDAAEE